MQSAVSFDNGSSTLSDDTNYKFDQDEWHGESHNDHAIVDADDGKQWHPFNTLEIFVRNKLETLGIKI